MKNVEKSSSAGTEVESRTIADVQHVSQPIAKPDVRRIPIEAHFAGDYRLEYDGKYITLYGKDNRYDIEGMFGAPKGTYDEMVLVPVVEEIRNASPEIIEVTATEILVSLGCA
jgi:hypothetical protein